MAHPSDLPDSACRMTGNAAHRPYPHDVTTSPKAPPPGLTVGGYALRARLGEGGMGVVHLGQKPGERPVAIKVLRPHVVGDDEARRRLAREVSSLTRVRSRRIAEIVDADPWGEIPYVATRYVPGLSLHDHVQEEGPLEGDDLLWFADCLAEALEAVHAVGVLHRDIKPSNVIMEGRTPILIDFGLARVADDSRITMTGWLLGTPGYLAPEILYGDDATAASDVHAWAATVAYAGTGRAPFGRGPSVAIMDRVRRGEHELSGLDPVILDLVEEALAPDAEDRPSLDEVRDWLEELAGGEPREPSAPPSPVTLPYVAGVRQELEAPTAVGTGVVPPALAEPVHWSDDWQSPPDLYDAGRTQGWGEAGTAPHRQTRVLPDGSVEYVGDYGPPAREHVPPGERFRRAGSLLALGGVVIGGIAVRALPRPRRPLHRRLAAAQRLARRRLGRQPPQPSRDQVVRRRPAAARRALARRGGARRLRAPLPLEPRHRRCRRPALLRGVGLDAHVARCHRRLLRHRHLVGAGLRTRALAHPSRRRPARPTRRPVVARDPPRGRPRLRSRRRRVGARHQLGAVRRRAVRGRTPARLALTFTVRGLLLRPPAG